eukprot:gene31373-38752_t
MERSHHPSSGGNLHEKINTTVIYSQPDALHVLHEDEEKSDDSQQDNSEGSVSGDDFNLDDFSIDLSSEDGNDSGEDEDNAQLLLVGAGESKYEQRGDDLDHPSRSRFESKDSLGY